VTELNSSKGTQQCRCLLPHLRTETDPVSETLCFLVFKIPDDGQNHLEPTGKCLGKQSLFIPRITSIYGSTALVDLSRFSVSWSFYTVGRTPWTGDQPVARPLPTHRTTQTQNICTGIEASSGIRTHDPSVRVGEDGSCPRQRGHCDRLENHIQYISTLRENNYEICNVTAGGTYSNHCVLNVTS
jgi:hypothetical protein